MDNKTAELNKAIAKSIGARVTSDTTVKLRIRCVGYAKSSKHYADAVVVAATSLVLSIDGVADTTFSGATGTLLFATYTTLGTLVDQINSSVNWEAEIVAGLRSDTINGSELLARSTSTFKMWEEVTLKADSSDNGVYKVGYCLEPGVAFDYVHGQSPKSYKTHRVGITRLRGLINTNAGEVISMTVYELKPDKASAYKTLAVYPGTDNTEKDTGATDEPLLHAGYGNSLLVELESTGTGWIDSAAYLDVLGVRE
jgi:hypothetical protein